MSTPMSLLLPDRVAPGLLRDETVAEELARLDEDDLVEMANLGPEITGIPGTIFISTAMGKHGPRVKYFDGRPSKGAQSYSVSIADPPVVVANSLPEYVANATSTAVKRWVTLNHDALLQFWHEGETMMSEDVAAFIAGLRRI